MAQGWLLYELTQSAVVLGYLGAATAIPAILMTMFGGAVADRFNKKYVLMTTSMRVVITPLQRSKAPILQAIGLECPAYFSCRQ